VTNNNIPNRNQDVNSHFLAICNKWIYIRCGLGALIPLHFSWNGRLNQLITVLFHEANKYRLVYHKPTQEIYPKSHSLPPIDFMRCFINNAFGWSLKTTTFFKNSSHY